MREQTRWQANGCLPLVFLFALPDGLPVENPVFEIDPTAADSRLIERCTANRSSSGAGVEADEKELCDVLCSRAVRFFSEMLLAHSPRRPQKARGLVSCEPSFAPLAAVRQDDRRRRSAEASFPMMPNGRPQVLKLATCSRLRPTFFYIGGAGCLVQIGEDASIIPPDTSYNSRTAAGSERLESRSIGPPLDSIDGDALNRD